MQKLLAQGVVVVVVAVVVVAAAVVAVVVVPRRHVDAEAAWLSLEASASSTHASTRESDGDIDPTKIHVAGTEYLIGRRAPRKFDAVDEDGRVDRLISDDQELDHDDTDVDTDDVSGSLTITDIRTGPKDGTGNDGAVGVALTGE